MRYFLLLLQCFVPVEHLRYALCGERTEVKPEDLRCEHGMLNPRALPLYRAVHIDAARLVKQHYPTDLIVDSSIMCAACARSVLEGMDACFFLAAISCLLPFRLFALPFLIVCFAEDRSSSQRETERRQVLEWLATKCGPGEGYYVHKRWLQDWKRGEASAALIDPVGELLCPHGALVPDRKAAAVISAEVCPPVCCLVSDGDFAGMGVLQTAI